MPDCVVCNRPLTAVRNRCHQCGACKDCCDCDEPCSCVDSEGEIRCDRFDRDELGLDPEED